MKYLIFSLLFLTFNAWAHEACMEALPSPLEELLELQKKLHWHAASDRDVKRAPCLRTKNFTVDEMKNWMKENDGKTIDSTVHGISFEDESEENINAFRHLTTAVTLTRRPDPERQKTFSSSCKKVQCAMEEIFGKSTATHLLFMHRKFGMNGSHLSYVNADPWRKNELDTLLLALSDFPEGILPSQENKQMIRFRRGYMRNGGERVLANATMEFFDPFNQQTSWQQRTTVTHEIAHVLAFESRVADASEWLNLGGWEKTTKVEGGKTTSTSTSPNRRAVSMYGEANHHEDFAEAVVAYRYNPELLKSVSPEKYDLIKTVVFDNVEYTSQNACQNPNRLSDDVRRKAVEKASQWHPSQNDLEQMAKACNELAVRKLAQSNIDLSQTEFQSCYEKAASDYKIKDLMNDELRNHPYKEFLAPLFRNNGPLPFPPEKLKSITDRTRDAHRATLKKEEAKTFKNYSGFNRGDCPDTLQYSYQYFDEEALGISTYSQKENFQSLTMRSCQQISQTRSYLRKKLNTKFTDKEIEVYVDDLIK